jgi:hypothetical protein
MERGAIDCSARWRLPAKIPQDFIDDREMLRGANFDVASMKSASQYS